ncbi:MAG TPA: acyltransferase [Acidimicrobiales bacterium]|nr:acyltransferase [Acidimicrobiales bacterium]
MPVPPLRPPLRRVALAGVEALWRMMTVWGTAGPDDAVGRRFRSFGAGSALGFPRGDVFNEWWITIGAGTLVCPFVNLSAGLPGEQLPQDGPPVVEIGDRCSIGKGSSLVGRCSIVLEDDVTVAPNVYITDHNHSYRDPEVPIGRQWVTEAPVRVGAGSWLGTGVVVLPGARIGRHVAVAAGSVVRGVIPDFCVVAGSPAKVTRRLAPGGWEPPIPGEAPLPPADWPLR